MIEVMILGFLAEGPLHGYELRRKMVQLNGYARAISDGTIYPAIKRLTAAGDVTQQLEPGVGAAQRHTLHLTAAGHDRLEQRLRAADGHDITDPARFFVILAFLSLLPDEGERRAVLRRRLDFLDRPTSFFSDGDHPLHTADIDDPYRRGILVSAIASNRAERAWLRQQLGLPATDGKA